jgi:transposase
MNLQISKRPKGVYLSIVKGIRNPDTKKVTHKSIRSLGYVHDLEKEYPDPIAHFRAVVAEMNKKQAEETPPAVITLKSGETVGVGERNRKNIGYAALSLIYHELGLHVFFNNRSRKLNSKYSVNAVMKLLVYSRILSPTSKKHTVENKDWYFEKFDLSLDDTYRCLSFVSTLKKALQLHIHKKITEQYGRSTEQVYSDVTNYYFEIDEPDALRKKGVNKEHRPDPIVQMGLFVDADGIPFSYDLFPGNTNDCETLLPILYDVKKTYGIGRIIVVADKGMNTGSNIAYNVIKGDGYVYSQTVRGANKEMKDYVLSDDGYQWIGETYKKKSRIYPREIIVEDINGKKKKVPIDEKQVVFYSRDYDRKAKAERAATVLKARDLVGCPAKYNRATSYGAAKYVRNLAFDKKTGAIITAGQAPVFDEEKLRAEERLDGYYAIVTSELNKTDEEIIQIYRGLWKIEETFKVTKSDLDARPVYVSREERIQAHFLVCFVALVIARLLQRRLGNEFSVSAIAESLSNVCCTKLEENWYVADYADEVTFAVKEHLSLDFSKKYLRHGEIKNILADSKKQQISNTF